MSEQLRTIAQKQAQAGVLSKDSALQRAALTPLQSRQPEIGPSQNGQFEHDFSEVKVYHHAPVAPQAKLTIGQPGDQYEQEAEHVADTVMRMHDTSASAIQTTGTMPAGQLHRQTDEDEGSMQRKGSAASQATTQAQSAPPIVHDVLHSSGQPLDVGTRSFMESHFGQDFSGVRVHADEHAAESAHSVNALAYTVGRDVVFGAGQYAPATVAGKKLLAHELTHVLQQHNASISPRVQRQLYPPIPIIVAPKRRKLSSGTANPGPGLTVSWSGTHANITAKLQIYGPEATNDVANSIKNTIESNWNASFSDGYSVTCHVQISVRAANASADSGATQIEIYRGTSASQTYPEYWIVGSQKTQLNINRSNALTWTAAHEFGHLLGLKDHYNEGIVSKFKAITGIGQRSEATIDKGYENNIMGVSGGKVESKNVSDLIDTYANVIDLSSDDNTTEAQADTATDNKTKAEAA